MNSEELMEKNQRRFKDGPVLIRSIALFVLGLACIPLGLVFLPVIGILIDREPAGWITLSDPVKPEALATVRSLSPPYGQLAIIQPLAKALDGWRAGLEHWTWEQHRVMQRHPWLDEVRFIERAGTPSQIAWIDLGLRALTAGAALLYYEFGIGQLPGYNYNNNYNNTYNQAPSNFTVAVSGLNANPSSFAGSLSGTQVTVSGSYSVTALQLSGYSATYSSGCTGTITQGESALCVVTESNIGGKIGLCG